MYRITVKSTQRAGGEQDSTQLTARGRFTFMGNSAVISYVEEAEDGGRTDVTIRATDTEVTVQRGRGPVSAPLRLALGQHCTSDYATPYGSFAITTYTRRIQNRLTNHGGTLTLVYDLEFGGGITETTLHLTVQKTEEPS